jgi:hypothetical protein
MLKSSIVAGHASGFVRCLKCEERRAAAGHKTGRCNM